MAFIIYNNFHLGSQSIQAEIRGHDFYIEPHKKYVHQLTEFICICQIHYNLILLIP